MTEPFKDAEERALYYESNGFGSAEDAARFVLAVVGLPTEEVRVSAFLSRSDLRTDLLRKAAARLHPDQGGSHEQFVRLQAAKRILEAK